jgi:hypothetical protein
MKEVVREAVEHKNYVPALRFAMAYPLAGELVRRVAALARGREVQPISEQHPLARIIQNSLFVGGIGILGDALISLERGKESALGLLLGPAVGTAVEAGTRGMDILGSALQERRGVAGATQKRKQATKGMARFLMRKVPFIGGRMVERSKSAVEKARTPKY